MEYEYNENVHQCNECVKIFYNEKSDKCPFCYPQKNRDRKIEAIIKKL